MNAWIDATVIVSARVTKTFAYLPKMRNLKITIEKKQYGNKPCLEYLWNSEFFEINIF